MILLYCIILFDASIRHLKNLQLPQNWKCRSHRTVDLELLYRVDTPVFQAVDKTGNETRTGWLSKLWSLLCHLHESPFGSPKY